MANELTEAQKTAAYEDAHAASLRALDKKIACGIGDRVRSRDADPSDTYSQQAMSAEDAFFIRNGRGDLARY